MGHTGGRDFLSDCWDYPWKVQLPAGAGVRKVTRCLFSIVSAGAGTALGVAGVMLGLYDCRGHAWEGCQCLLARMGGTPRASDAVCQRF